MPLFRGVDPFFGLGGGGGFGKRKIENWVVCLVVFGMSKMVL